MAVILNIEMPECCDLCLFGCWSTLHQTAECYLMKDTQMFDDFSTKYKTRRSVNCPMKEHKPRVERKKGKWIGEYTGKPVEVIEGRPQESCECSVCGKWLIASDEYGVNGNFCPYCGADMRGGNDE